MSGHSYLVKFAGHLIEIDLGSTPASRIPTFSTNPSTNPSLNARNPGDESSFLLERAYYVAYTDLAIHFESGHVKRADLTARRESIAELAGISQARAPSEIQRRNASFILREKIDLHKHGQIVFPIADHLARECRWKC
jgi:hypothetical protein